MSKLDITGLFENIDKESELVCEDCGTNKDVKKTLCPYELEIHGKEIEITVCNSCYNGRWENT